MLDGNEAFGEYSLYLSEMLLWLLDLGECFSVILDPLDQAQTRPQRSEAGCVSCGVVVASGKGAGPYPEEPFIFGPPALLPAAPAGKQTGRPHPPARARTRDG